MKKSIDIIGLPVFSIAQGREIGKVKQFVINPVQGAVEALIIDDGKWYLGAKLLPMSGVTALGEYAVTVNSIGNILKVNEIPDIEKLLDEDVRVIGTNVLTNTGRIRGKVTEIIIDETGKIAFCEIEEVTGEIAQLPADRVLTYGKEVLIVSDEKVKVETVNIAEPLKTSDVVKAASQVKASNAAENTTPVAEVKNSQVEANETDESVKKFDDRHRKYLLGKKSSKRIETDNGMLIVEQGGEITEEVLQKAKLAGKFVELSMNIQ